MSHKRVQMASSSRGQRLSLRAMEAGSAASSAGRAAAPASKSSSDALGLDIDTLDILKEDLDRDNGKRRHDMSSIDRGSTKQKIQQKPAASCAASRRSADTLPTAQELAQRGTLVLFKQPGGPARSALPSSVRKLTYAVLVRALEARDAIKLSHAQALRDVRINKDKLLGYLLADLIDEELPSPEDAERKGKRIATHCSVESKRIDAEKVRFAEQACAAKRAAGNGGLSESELSMRLAEIESEELAAIKDIENAAYTGWERPSFPRSRADTQRESKEGEYELTPEEQEEVAQGVADDMTRDAIAVLLEPFHSERDYATQARKSFIKGHLHLWRATTEANLLAAGLVERSLLDKLRDRDTDVEYYRSRLAVQSEVMGALQRELQLVRAQVCELGGTPREPTGLPSFADAPIDRLQEALSDDE